MKCDSPNDNKSSRYLYMEHCDIWKKHEEGYWVGVPTNPGWNRNNENTMGAGLAFQARSRFPELPRLYGTACRDQYQKVGIPPHLVGVVWFDEFRIVCLPTKPLDTVKPWLSWRQNSTVDRIESTLQRMTTSYSVPGKWPIYIPMLGCGCGKLRVDEVLPLLQKYLCGTPGNYQYAIALYNRMPPTNPVEWPAFG